MPTCEAYSLLYTFELACGAPWRTKMCYFDGHVRELGAISGDKIERLKAKVDENPDLWAIEDRKKPNKYEMFRDSTEHIIFRYPVDLDDHRRYSDYPLWEKWRVVIDPILQEATTFYGYERGTSTRIMLARLLAGRTIQMHIDNRQRSARFPHKIHVPIRTAAGVEFWEEDAVYHLETGRAYEVNNQVMHGGANKSAIDRVHLIFDYWNDMPPSPNQEQWAPALRAKRADFP